MCRRMFECHTSSEVDVILSDESHKDIVKQLSAALSQNESLKQECHCLRRQLDVASKNASCVGEDLDYLQQQLRQQEEKAKLQLREMEGKHCHESVVLSEKVEMLEERLKKEKSEHEESVARLKMQLGSSSKEDSYVQSNANELKEFEDMKIQINTLQEALDKADGIEIELHREKESLVKQNRMIMQEKCELQQALVSKREELTSCMNNLTDLKEEHAMVLNELDMLKTVPARLDKKGNSVFAEVEDNRQALKRSLDTLASKYKRLKKEVGQKKMEVATLMAENSTLHKKIIDVQTDFSCESHLISSYMERIKDLESSLKSQKETITVKVINGDSAGFEWMESVLQSKSKEADTLKAKLEEQSVNHMMRSEALFRTERELKLVRAQVLQLKSEESRLKQLLEVKGDMLSPDVKSGLEDIKENKVPQDHRLSASTVPCKSSRLFRDEMESCVPAKICRFSADTAEPSTAKAVHATRRNPMPYKKLVISSSAQV